MVVAIRNRFFLVFRENIELVVDRVWCLVCGVCGVGKMCSFGGFALFCSVRQFNTVLLFWG